MRDLSIFNPEVGDSNGSITHITPTPKRGRKKGGDLSTVGKESLVASITSAGFDENSIQSVKIISQAYGADHLPQLLERLVAEATGQKEVFEQTQALEESLTISRHLNVERAEKLGREKGSRQMELRQLLKLKSDADKWMPQRNPDFEKVEGADEWLPSDFEDMIIHYATVGLPYNQIVTTMTNHAWKLHINLINFQIQKDGKFNFPDWEFIHADKIEACKARLAELGVELSKLKELGIELE
jgi:hypothetical protein